MENRTYMIEKETRGPYVSLEASLKIENNTVGEQITAEQLIKSTKL